MTSVSDAPSAALVPSDSAVQRLDSRALDLRRIVRHDMQDARPADAFRDLRTQLLARTDSRVEVILVAPVGRGSGGSYVALNLAAAFAFDETRQVVLVDCNLRQPCLHQRLDVEPRQGGLVDYLEGRVDNLAQVLYASGLARLTLLPVGTRREASGDLLGHARMRGLIDSLRSVADKVTVILDAPAANVTPDARILAEMTDCCVLVAGYGRDTPAAVQSASAVLNPQRLAGVVFNRVP